MEEGRGLKEVLGLCVHALQRGKTFVLKAPQGGIRGLLLAELSRGLSKRLLVVVPTEEAAEGLVRDLRFFSPEGDFGTFSADPYDLEAVTEGLDLLPPLTGDDMRGLVITPEGLSRKLPSPEAVRSRQIRLRLGQRWRRDELIGALLEMGYERVRMVEGRAEMSVRGAILDLFPPDRDRPLRVEFIDEEVCSLRSFDPVSQRSAETVQEAVIPPAKLEGEATLLDHFPSAPLVLVEPEEVEGRLRDFAESLNEKLQPLFHHPEPLIEALMGRPGLLLDGVLGDGVRLEARLHHGLREEVKAKGLKALAFRLREWLQRGYEVNLVSSTPHQAQRLAELLEEYGFKASLGGALRGRVVGVRQGELSRGFLLPREGLVYLTEEEVFGQRGRLRTPRRQKPPSYHFEDLKPGDYVVHVDYGIGLFKGLVRLEGEGGSEFLLIEYEGGDRLYVPVERLELVHRYIGPSEQPPRLDRLGGTAWRRAKRRARRAVQEVAKELVELYASRKTSPGFAFSPPDTLFREFEASFPYEETPDQWEAIEAVIEDMCSPTPMDRLVCGDVGFGKTEVAIRAAFKAVMDGKQVAVLVPTTVLAEQHYRTFKGRFERYPIVVEVLSRFRSPSEQRRILDDLGAGKIDVIIGTHRLLQKDVAFRDLGLLIVDEEQRFGVAHKERLKELKKTVDCLTLTATPIPRTLQMALVGLKEMSLINTPPPDRQSIKTRLIPFDQRLIREAILRELRRGGQVFFVHNRVADIEAVARRLKEMVPEARVAVAHGQMRGRRLEEVMMRFIRGEVDVLVSTSIIESGLDIPNANTIIIHRADRFGLADLYQLRGRVGRSPRKAYAYLVLPSPHELTREARKRLRALQELTELGSGFRLALRDLEIRGAGTLFGHRQSGHIADVGLELYNAMLEEAIRELKGEEVKERVSPEIHLPIEAHIPQQYVEDDAQRLLLYKRLSMVEDESSLQEMEREIRDRYGPLPQPVKDLLEVIRIKIGLQRLGISRLEVSDGTLRAKLSPGAVAPERLVSALKGQERFRLTPSMELVAPLKGIPWHRVLGELEGLLKGARGDEIMASGGYATR